RRHLERDAVGVADGQSLRRHLRKDQQEDREEQADEEVGRRPQGEGQDGMDQLQAEQRGRGRGQDQGEGVDHQHSPQEAVRVLLQALQGGRFGAPFLSEVTDAEPADGSQGGLRSRSQRGGEDADDEDGRLAPRLGVHGYLKSSETLRFSCTRMIASASRGATESTVNGAPRFPSGTGMESVSTTSSKGAPRRFSSEFPVSTAWDAAA